MAGASSWTASPTTSGPSDRAFRQLYRGEHRMAAATQPDSSCRRSGAGDRARLRCAAQPRPSRHGPIPPIPPAGWDRAVTPPPTSPAGSASRGRLAGLPAPRRGRPGRACRAAWCARSSSRNAWCSPSPGRTRTGKPGHETLVTVTFADEDGKTRLTFQQAVFKSVEDRDSHARTAGASASIALTRIWPTG